MEIEKKICIWSRSGDIGTVPNLLKNKRKLFFRSNRNCLKTISDRATWVWCLFKFIWYNQNPFLLFQCIAICCALFKSSTTMPLQFCYFFLPPATHSFSALGTVFSCPSSRDRQVRDERQDRQIWHLNLTFQVPGNLCRAASAMLFL